MIFGSVWRFQFLHNIVWTVCRFRNNAVSICLVVLELWVCCYLHSVVWLAWISQFRFFKTGSKYCYTRICEIVWNLFMECGVVIPSIFVYSIRLVFNEGCSSFASRCLASCGDCSFRFRVCSSDSFILSVCVKKNCSSSLTSEEDVITSPR